MAYEKEFLASLVRVVKERHWGTEVARRAIEDELDELCGVGLTGDELADAGHEAPRPSRRPNPG